MKKSQNTQKINMKSSIIRLSAAALALCAIGVGCATSKPPEVTPDQAAKLDRKLVKEAVIYEPGTEQGAVVPEISAPRLHAIAIPEHIENGRLVEKHREWILEGNVSILGIPKQRAENSK
jgi:hypothetical protein